MIVRIGLLTLSASDNCGSLLQCFALKKRLEEYGDVEVINFSSEKSHAMYDVFPKGESIRRRILTYPRKKAVREGKAGYNEFRKEYLGIAGKEYFQADLAEIKDRYDVVVVGSDQVWNVQMCDFDEAFFLGWTHAKKVAYAPSLGGRHLKLSAHFDQIKAWLDDFTYLSVREEVGKGCLDEVTGCDVPKVLDPTLIVDEEFWNGAVNEPIIKGDYIFYYSWAYQEDSTAQIVADESKRTGLPVYVIDPRKWITKNPAKWGFHLCKESGPLIFLNLMKYAKKCYVESFHGMVFAYIYRKDFWLLDTHENLAELDTRLMEFVRLLGAEDRVLTQYNVSRINQDKPKDYEENALLENMRKASQLFLDTSMKSMKE